MAFSSTHFPPAAVGSTVELEWWIIYHAEIWFRTIQNSFRIEKISTAAPSRAATRRAVGRKKLLPTMVSRRIEALTFCSAASRIPSGLWLQIFGFMPSFRSRPYENRHQNRNICISFSVPASTNTRKMVKIDPYQTKNTFSPHFLGVHWSPYLNWKLYIFSCHLQIWIRPIQNRCCLENIWNTATVLALTGVWSRNPYCTIKGDFLRW